MELSARIELTCKRLHKGFGTCLKLFSGTIALRLEKI